jgi:thiamine transporter ThiT
MKSLDIRIKRLCLAGIFLALGLLLPFFTGQIPRLGSLLLPMHLPVFLRGLLCGWQYGLAVGGAFTTSAVCTVWNAKNFPNRDCHVV